MPRKPKKETAAIEPKVLDFSLEDIVADRFSRYSKYIIQERALPDARDGLKPVQRRILWAMEEDGNTARKPYRKSAKTVGNVIGNYHPHGESSVYYAIVRMSQDWKSSLPLIDMQGNNGSIDDDPAAAMRYTEARLSPIAEYLMEDIDKETVDWSPNYSDEKMEPTVLPARFPNLLVQGISGIAAGYATSIPPHNFNEVIEAAVYRIDHPECTYEELAAFVKGPDFPTGGLIMGKEGIAQALQTGKGRVTVRAKAEIEEGRTINRIVISEIPYEVVKSALVRRMDELRLNGKINGLLDVRDESDRKGLRIVCDLKKEANAQVILNYLYKNTDLQVYFHYNTVAIVNKTPCQLSLADILDAFLEHREQVVLARSRYDWKAKSARLHLVEGLMRAISILDDIIALIRSSNGKADAKKNLMAAHGFSEEQAEAIVTMQLYRLSNTDIVQLENEQAQLHKDIEVLQGLIEKPAKRKTLMKKELQALSKAFDMPRRTQIVGASGDVVIDERDMIVNEKVMVTLSREGYAKRVSMRSYASSQKSPGGTGKKEGDQLVFNQEVSTLDTLIFFTDHGRVGTLPVYALEEKKWKDMGSHYSSWFKTEPQEKIIAAHLWKEDAARLDLVMATRNGLLYRVHVEDLPLGRKNRLSTFMNIAPSDALAFVDVLRTPEQSVLLVSEQGYGVRYLPDELTLFKGKARGVKGMNLKTDDQLVLMAVGTDESVVLENSDGQFKRLSFSDLDTSGRPAKGVRLFKEIKSRPVTLKDAAIYGAGETVRFEETPESDFILTDLPKMTPSSTWSNVHQLETPQPFVLKVQTIGQGELNAPRNDEQLALELG